MSHLGPPEAKVERVQYVGSEGDLQRHQTASVLIAHCSLVINADGEACQKCYFDKRGKQQPRRYGHPVERFLSRCNKVESIGRGDRRAIADQCLLSITARSSSGS